jgi:hypothetical protein
MGPQTAVIPEATAAIREEATVAADTAAGVTVAVADIDRGDVEEDLLIDLIGRRNESCSRQRLP